MSNNNVRTNDTSGVVDEQRELVIDFGAGCGSLSIQSHHTWADARDMIKNEFDDDMIPSDEDWVFHVDGIRKTKKQEGVHRPWQAIGRHVVIGPKDLILKRKNEADHGKPPSSSKRFKASSSLDSSDYSSRVITPANVGGSTGTVATSKTKSSSTDNGIASATSCPSKDLDSDPDSDDAVMDPVVLEGRLDEHTELSSRNNSDKENLSNNSTKSRDKMGKPSTATLKAGESKVDTDDDSSSDEEVGARHEKAGSASMAVSKRASASIDWDDSDDDDELLLSSDEPDPDENKKDPPEQYEDLQVTQVEPPTDENPHKDADQALTTCRTVIRSIETILNEQEHFCSEARRREWLQETKELMGKTSPDTIIGVLGNTGVGKSSLLNALLDEANVLPTSGSRGCTAAVVELIFNWSLLGKENKDVNHDEVNGEKVAVYRGMVEFMALEDWNKELKVLIDECSTQEKTVYAIVPIEDSSPVAFAAWQKINQVYGRGTMEKYHGKRSGFVYDFLSKNTRVRQLLTPQTPGAKYNVHVIKEGECVPGSEDARNLLSPNKARDRRTRKSWAKNFRAKINNYVYRTGSGHEAQMWPLIRKVQLFGPWNVLSTGACLVDLPGVRDANVARAKVAEQYLQNCDTILIVAPIKRAVDDKTARDLMGEQFKRRLLMDGKYGSVAFICTQTDDLETSETMRDHEDVAVRLGHWEKMQELATEIQQLEQIEYDKSQEEDDLEVELKEATSELKEARKTYQDALRAIDDDESDEEVDSGTLEELKVMISQAKRKKTIVENKIKNWKQENERSMAKDRIRCMKLQRKLKPLCSIVRNEYSSKCLQEDFKSGLKELYRKDDEGPEIPRNEDSNALPDNFDLPVFCLSANDYLKLTGIKESRDGPPNCFSLREDTQIPKLRLFIHGTTSKFRKSFASSFVEHTNDLLDRVKLLATDSKEAPTGRVAYRLKSTFDTEMGKLSQQITPIAKDFVDKANLKVSSSLERSLKVGAQNGTLAAMDIVQSWGSTNRRVLNHRSLQQNGLHHSTYNAVVRREGVYQSATVGGVDLNQELLDPMEEKFSTTWQSVMDAYIRSLLSFCETKATLILTKWTSDLTKSLIQAGMDKSRAGQMMTTASRSCSTAIRGEFQRMLKIASDSQRELSRDLLPQIQERMRNSYVASMSVRGGNGKFMRMKLAMGGATQGVVNSMFEDAMNKVLTSIVEMIKSISEMISSLDSVIETAMKGVFSICWDSQSESQAIDPAAKTRILECRYGLLPELNRLLRLQDEASKLVGIERQEAELELMEVDTLEQRLAKQLEQAKQTGDAFDLCDSDAELDVKPKAKVKTEPKRRNSSAAAAKVTKVDGVLTIDLCDSDDDDEILDQLDKLEPRSGRSMTAARVKVEKGYV